MDDDSHKEKTKQTITPFWLGSGRLLQPNVIY
jgi:hypothetical protein